MITRDASRLQFFKANMSRSTRNPHPVYNFGRTALLSAPSLHEMARRGLEGAVVSGICLDTLLPTTSPGRVSLRNDATWYVAKFTADRQDRNRYVRITRLFFSLSDHHVREICTPVVIPGTDISLHGYTRPYVAGVKLTDIPYRLLDTETLDAMRRSFGALLYRLLCLDVVPVCARFAHGWDLARDDETRKCSFLRFLANVVYDDDEMVPFSAGGLFFLTDSKERAEFHELIPRIETNFATFMHR